MAFQKLPCSGMFGYEWFGVVSCAIQESLWDSHGDCRSGIFLMVLAWCEHSGDRGCINQGNDNRICGAHLLLAETQVLEF